MRLTALKKAIQVALIAQVLSGCQSYPEAEKQDDVLHQWITGTAEGNVRRSVSKESVIIEPEFSNFEINEKDYLVGTGDLLSLNIFGEPGMDSLVVRVDGLGNIQVPVIHSFKAAGQSLSSIQQGLIEKFSTEFKAPWVVVEIKEYRSQPLYFIGEFNAPGVIYLDRPTKLLEALGLAQGLSDNAYLPGARLLRNSEVMPVDIQALLKEGKFDFNVSLTAGDTLYVPSQRDLKVFILGAVANPGEQLFSQEKTLLEVISKGTPKTSAKLNDVRIIRTHSAVKGELIIADAERILQGQVPDLPLRPGDIVYIPNNLIGSWNDIVEEISPTFSFIGATLEPFVQIRFLTEEDN
jgi:polysaccharide export outer membrane protein